MERSSGHYGLQAIYEGVGMANGTIIERINQALNKYRGCPILRCMASEGQPLFYYNRII
ncbi:hypothetical protein [Bacillus massilinigeriensis]|uniref:hypothetical protein n=1 Tax=Bacillus massilionigeriensis TaxID=1805475 RepID=UPI0013564D49|nr:hypothetical protein [Bacillus massilionigeriensis]